MVSPMRSFCTLAVFVATVSAFCPPSAPFGIRRTSLPPLCGAFDKDEGGGAAIAKPDVKIAQTTKTVEKVKQRSKQKAKTSEPVSRRDERFEEAPLYKVLLLWDDDYEQEHVCDRLQDLMDDMDEGNAVNVFSQAENAGQAVCGKYPFEQAELYKEQLLRSDPMIYADLEKEDDGKKKGKR